MPVLELSPAERKLIKERKLAIRQAKETEAVNGRPHASTELPRAVLDQTLATVEITADNIVDDPPPPRIIPTDTARLAEVADASKPYHDEVLDLGKQLDEHREIAASKPRVPPSLRSLVAYFEANPEPVKLDDLADAIGVNNALAKARFYWARREGYIPSTASFIDTRKKHWPGPIGKKAPKPVATITADDQADEEIEVETVVPDPPATPSPVAAIAAAPDKFDLALRVLGQFVDVPYADAIEVLDFAKRAVELMRL